jgi:ferredoxin
VKVWIETGQCTGSGLCELIEGQVFALGEDGLARVLQAGHVLPPGPDNPAEVPDSYADVVSEASRACPGGCIRFEL